MEKGLSSKEPTERPAMLVDNMIDKTVNLLYTVVAICCLQVLSPVVAGEFCCPEKSA